MAHPTRGHRSGTYEIEEIIDVNAKDLTITYRHAAAYLPQVAKLNVEHSAAAEQMVQAMAASIKIGTNGDSVSGWESSVTLERGSWYAAIMVKELNTLGFDTFSDPSIDVPVLRGLYKSLASNTKRSACWLLARVVRDNHPNGVAISRALKGSRFQTEDSNPFTYDEEVALAIENCARGVFTDRFAAQRELFQRLGYDVAGRNWLRIPAEDLINWAKRAHPDAADSHNQPSLAESYEKQVAWALMHPERFGRVKYTNVAQVRGPGMKQIGQALYPDNVHVTAAVILHCLGENAGFNHSVILQKNCASLTYLGSEHALEHNVKARNKSQDTRATALTSIYTPGGILQTMTGLTRFSRNARRHLKNPDGTQATVVDRLYVEHEADPKASSVIDSVRQQNAWRQNAAFDSHWDEAAAGERSKVPLRFQALRLFAQSRAMKEGIRNDVHGHTERTKTHYSAHVLPDHVFNRHAASAQNSMHDTAVGGFSIVAEATEGPAAELAAVDPGMTMDVEVGLCVSGGNAPDGSNRRCGLGMVACFTCPNGYRTVDHIPGLLAAVELGNVIERNDPTEWINGQASELRYYSQACLDQFPPLVVANVKRTTDLVPHILTVTGLYMEMRHG